MITEKQAIQWKAERDELLEAFERLHRISSVELGKTRPSIVDWGQSILDKIKVSP